MKAVKRIALALSFLCLLATAHATEMVGAQSASLGGTGRAAIEPTESLFLNPASLALLQQFYSGFSYQTGFLSQEVSRNTFGLVLADASTYTTFPGALAYRRHKINNAGSEITENEFRLGGSTRITPRWSVGVGAVHLEAVDAAGREFKQTNFDIGTLFGLMPNWGLSFSAENLIRPEEGIVEALVRPSRLALGTQYIYERVLTLRYESLLPLYTENTSLLGHRLGLSLNSRGNLFLNGGFSVDDAVGQNWASFGLAWKGPRLKLAYSYQREQRQGLGVRHLVDLWLDVW